MRQNEVPTKLCTRLDRTYVFNVYVAQSRIFFPKRVTFLSIVYLFSRCGHVLLCTVTVPEYNMDNCLLCAEIRHKTRCVLYVNAFYYLLTLTYRCSTPSVKGWRLVSANYRVVGKNFVLGEGTNINWMREAPKRDTNIFEASEELLHIFKSALWAERVLKEVPLLFEGLPHTKY